MNAYEIKIDAKVAEQCKKAKAYLDSFTEEPLKLQILDMEVEFTLGLRHERPGIATVFVQHENKRHRGPLTTLIRYVNRIYGGKGNWEQRLVDESLKLKSGDVPVAVMELRTDSGESKMRKWLISRGFRMIEPGRWKHTKGVIERLKDGMWFVIKYGHPYDPDLTFLRARAAAKWLLEN